MEKIEVTTRFSKQGSLIPLDFKLKEEKISILDTGRQWETDQGRHILVMDQLKRTHHLFFQIKDLGWYLIRDIKSAPERI